MIKKTFDPKINDYIVYAGSTPWVVKAVEARRDYTLLLTFASGEKRLYNALPLLDKAIYGPLKNIGLFMNAKVEGASVAWNDELDIAPEHLYECSVPVQG